MAKKISTAKKRPTARAAKRRNASPALRLVPVVQEPARLPASPPSKTVDIAIGEADLPDRPENFPKMVSWPGMALVCWLFTSLIGVVGISGWFGGPKVYAGMGWAPIAQSEATLFIFTGLALVFFVYGVTRALARPIVTAAIVLSSTFSVLKLIESMGQAWFGVENLFNLKLHYFQNFLVGTMSPVSAVLFIAMGICLTLLVLVADQRKLAVKWAMGICTMCALFCSLVVLSYAFGNPLMYQGTITPLSLPAALAFLFLQAGTMIAIGPTHFPFRIELNRGRPSFVRQCA